MNYYKAEKIFDLSEELNNKQKEQGKIIAEQITQGKTKGKINGRIWSLETKEKDLDIIIGLIKDGFLWGCMPDWKLYIN